MKRILLLVLCSVICVSGYSQINANLMACYPFDGSADDMSGNLHHGVVNGATLTSDRFGNPSSAYQFDGVNDYINIGPYSGMTLGNDFSMSVWIQPDQVKLQTILILQPDNFNDRLNAMQYYSHNGQSTTFWDYGNCSNGGRLSDVGTTFSNAWQHFVFTVSQNGGMKVYKDGILTNVLLTSSQVVNKGRNLWIGGGIDHVGAQFFFDGKIDDIRLYDKELSSGEVLTLNGMNTLCQFTSLQDVADNNYSVTIKNDMLEIGINTYGKASDFRLYTVEGKELFMQNNILPGDRISIPLHHLSNQILLYTIKSPNQIMTGKVGYVR